MRVLEQPIQFIRSMFLKSLTEHISKLWNGKRIYIVGFAVMIVILTTCVSLNVSAEYKSFETKPLSLADITSIWDSLSLVSYSVSGNVPSVSAPIRSFGVSESGALVVGLKNNQIVVSDENRGVYKWFKFKAFGSFYVDWHQNNILLFLVRSCYIVEFTTDGELVSIKLAENNNATNAAVWNELFYRKTIYVNGSTYCMKNSSALSALLFGQTYSTISKTNGLGEETVLFDVGEQPIHLSSKYILLWCVFVGLAAFLAPLLLRHVKKPHRS